MGLYIAIILAHLLLLFVVSISALDSQARSGLENQADKQESKAFDEYKLDRILEQLEFLTIKQEEIFRLIKVKENQNQPTSGCSCNQDKDDLDISNKQIKRESRDDRTSTTRKDLFHFNKLSASEATNSIPSGSLPVRSSERSNGDGWSETAWSTSLSISQQYESMFGGAIENLTRILKEQLAGFRSTQNKLMNRIIDHSYQYNMITNQLSFIKDECSLAASNNNYKTLIASNQVSDSAATTNQPQSSMNALKTSDISVLVRLMSQEINQALMTNKEELTRLAAHLKESPDNVQVQTEQLGKTEFLKETNKLMKKMEEIDSVVKQSALFLTKLNSYATQILSSSPPSNQGSSDQVPPLINSIRNQQNVNILTYNNSDSSLAIPGNTRHQVAPDRNFAAQLTRWLPGSKVPGGGYHQVRNYTDQHHPSTANQDAKSQPTPTTFCQSKTSLVTPSSCQQLRLAGANCTGQYYVFVRGSIKHVYCDMNMDSADDGGGWTVVLRRLDKSLPSSSSAANSSAESPPSNQILRIFRASQVNFDLNWFNYKSGFGHLDDWAEFFSGLDLLHQLSSSSSDSTLTISTTTTNETELQIDLETSENNELHLKFDGFSVDNEEGQYRMFVRGCNASLDRILCEPFLRLNGTKFYTSDRLDNDDELVVPTTNGHQKCQLNLNDTGYDGGVNNNNKLSPQWGWWRKISESSGSNSTKEASSCPTRNLLMREEEDQFFFPFTGPIGKFSANNGKGRGKGIAEEKHLYWPNWVHSREPLRKLVIKIRRKRSPFRK